MPLDHISRARLIVSLCLLFAGVAPSSASTTGTAPDAGSSSAGETNDGFRVILFGNPFDAQKYLTFGWNGWSGNTVRWRYNDANRPSSIAASASAAVDRIQTAMNKWSAACNVQFAYDGVTANPASLATGARDGVNVIAWGALSGNTTGITYAGASGFTGTTFTLDESDMVVNYLFNPNLDSTLVHEVGHMLGLKHSNQEGTVMSGPNAAPDPSTTYTSLTSLQADDIAGCRALYGPSSTSPSAPAAVASASMLSFADTTVGASSSAQSVTLTNTGNASLAISGVAVSGSGFSLVSTTCNAGAALLPGASCVVAVRFSPTETGVRSGTLSISHNATPPTTSVGLTGNGVAPAGALRAIATVNVTALAIPETTVGAVSPGMAITLSNTGNLPMALGSVTTASSAFRVVASNCAFATAFLLPGARCTTLFAFAPISVGEVSSTVLFTHGAGVGLTQVPISGTGVSAPDGVPTTRDMVEYRYAPLDYYFITSRDAEKAALDITSGFSRTGATFPVYAQQQIGMRGITRFFFDRVAQGNSRGSHFYTALDDDLLTLADQNPTLSTAPGFAQNEGVDSYAYSPLVSGVGGSCASGLQPVYRLFRGSARFPDNPNHRYTTSITTYNTFVAEGWTGEGVNFCVPAN